ncbi:hypothetical protein SEVIR_2G131216v4 [Setaria viridis]
MSLEGARECRVPRWGVCRRLRDAHQRACRQPARTWRGDGGQPCGPMKMKQVAMTIEMFTDFDTTSVEEVIGWLRVAEDADVEEVADGVGRLYLTEEHWEARRRQRRGKERASGDAARHGSNKKVGGRDDGHDEDGDGASTVSWSSRRLEHRNRGKGFNYGKHGHITRDYPESRKERALFANIDADEPTLL